MITSSVLSIRDMKLRQRIPKLSNIHNSQIIITRNRKNNQKITKTKQKKNQKMIKNKNMKTKKIKKNNKIRKISIKQRKINKKEKKIIQKTVQRVANLRINDYRRKLRPQRILKKVQSFHQDLNFMAKSHKNNKKSNKKKNVMAVQAPVKVAQKLIKTVKTFKTVSKSKPKIQKSTKSEHKSKKKELKKKNEKKMPSEVIKRYPRTYRAENRKNNLIEQKTLSQQDKKDDDLNYISVNIVKLQDDPDIKSKSLVQLQMMKSRYQRRLYVKSIYRSNTIIKFDILDPKLTSRMVNFNFEKISCGCFTYRSTRQPCQHILFVVKKVLKNEDLQDHLKYKTQISQDIYAKIDNQVLKKFYKRFPKKQGEEQEYESDLQVCEICFEDRDDLEQKQECKKCGKTFHKQCCQTFRKIKENCPLCKQLKLQNKEIQTIKMQPVSETTKLWI